MLNQFEGRNVRLAGQDILGVYIPTPLAGRHKWELVGMQGSFFFLFIGIAWVAMHVRRYRN